jgi:hypothetical protein
MRNANNIFIGKSEGNRSCRRSRHRQEDNIRMNLRKWGAKLWTGFIWLRK